VYTSRYCYKALHQNDKGCGVNFTWETSGAQWIPYIHQIDASEGRMVAAAQMMGGELQRTAGPCQSNG